MFASLTLLHKNAAFPQAVAALMMQHGLNKQPVQLAANHDCYVWQWVFAGPIPQALADDISQLMAADMQQGQADYILYAGAHVSDQSIYDLVEAMVKNREELAKNYASFGGLDPSKMSKNVNMPFHPGAEKYYKASGLWAQ